MKHTATKAAETLPPSVAHAALAVPITTTGTHARSQQGVGGVYASTDRFAGKSELPTRWRTVSLHALAGHVAIPRRACGTNASGEASVSTAIAVEELVAARRSNPDLGALGRSAIKVQNARSAPECHTKDTAGRFAKGMPWHHADGGVLLRPAWQRDELIGLCSSCHVAETLRVG